jgi:hypothetical protein
MQAALLAQRFLVGSDLLDPVLGSSLPSPEASKIQHNRLDLADLVWKQQELVLGHSAGVRGRDGRVSSEDRGGAGSEVVRRLESQQTVGSDVQRHSAEEARARAAD